MMKSTPYSTLFPYTTLFRSVLGDHVQEAKRDEPHAHLHRARALEDDERAVDEEGDDEQIEQIADDFRERARGPEVAQPLEQDRKSTRLNSSHRCISYAVFCLNDEEYPVFHTLSLHDALPICTWRPRTRGQTR